MGKLIVGVVSAGVALTFFIVFWPLAQVPAGHVGIVTLFGSVTERPLEPGISIINPFARVIKMTVQQWTMKYAGEAGTKDLQTVRAEVMVNAHLNTSLATKVYSDFGMAYDQTLISPIIPDRVKSVTARYNAEELITKRDEVRRQIKQSVIDGVNERAKGAVTVDDVVVTNFGFAASFTKAVEDKQVAEQLAAKAKNDLERIKVEAQQQIATAQAQAESFRLQAQQITPAMIEMEKIKKWNGELPTYVGGGVNPFLSLK